LVTASYKEGYALLLQTVADWCVAGWVLFQVLVHDVMGSWVGNAIWMGDGEELSPL
jgi:hypothetical protein